MVIYYKPSDVALHNIPQDIWVSFLGNVYDLTPLIDLYDIDDPAIKPILAFAGKDISHWFDEETGDIKYFVHPITGVSVPYCSNGKLHPNITHVPNTQWKPIKSPPWWKDDKYKIGKLSSNVRPLRIYNTLIRQEILLNVCAEDTLEVIQEQRAKNFNSHWQHYTWKYERRVLDVKKTLDENGIPDNKDKYTSLHQPESLYVPTLFVYYNDDLEYTEEY